MSDFPSFNPDIETANVGLRWEEYKFQFNMLCRYIIRSLEKGDRVQEGTFTMIKRRNEIGSESDQRKREREKR